MKITVLTLKQVFLDGKPSGSVVTVLTLFPELLDDLQAALEAWHADATADLQAAQDTAAATIALLRAQLDPTPPPAYYLIVPLDPPVQGATHAGILQPPKIGGAWIYDLLIEKSPGAYGVLRSDQQAPAAAKLTTFAELTPDAASADIARSLNAPPAPGPDAPADAMSAAAPAV